MPESLDIDTMIEALTDGVGWHFGQASRRSFYVQLESLQRNESFQSAPLEQRQSFVDLLAIASFYQSVIVPIRSSASFVAVLKRAGATHLRVAKEKLDTRYARNALTATAAFQFALAQARIPERLLRYATLRHFITSVREHYHRNS